MGANRIRVLIEGDSDDGNGVEGRKLVGEETCSGFLKGRAGCSVEGIPEYYD